MNNTAPMYWLYVCMYICDIDAVKYFVLRPTLDEESRSNQGWAMTGYKAEIV